MTACNNSLQTSVIGSPSFGWTKQLLPEHNCPCNNAVMGILPNCPHSPPASCPLPPFPEELHDPRPQTATRSRGTTGDQVFPKKPAVPRKLVTPEAMADLGSSGRSLSGEVSRGGGVVLRSLFFFV